MDEEQYVWSSELLVAGLCEGYQLNEHNLFYFKNDGGVWKVSASEFDGAIPEPLYLNSNYDALAAGVCMKILQLIRRERETEHLCVYDELEYFKEIFFSEEYQEVEVGPHFLFHEFLKSSSELIKV